MTPRRPELGDGERNAVDGDRSLVHHVAKDAIGGFDLDAPGEAVGDDADDGARPVDVPLDDMTAEPVGRPQRELEVDRRPACAPASELRCSVSFITSVVNVDGAISVAVRHTPLTAIESPSRSSPVTELATVSRTPSSERSSRVISPRSSMSPVNISASPILDPGRDEQILSDPLALERQRSHGIGDLLDALALEGITRGAPAEDQRCQEQPDLVHLTGVQKRPGEMRAALEQDRADSAAPN